MEWVAHKCVLVARSDYFYEMFATRWRHRSVVHIRNELVDPAAFGAMLSYVYTEQLEAPLNLIDDVTRIAKQCRLGSLVARLESIQSKADFFRKREITSAKATHTGTHFQRRRSRGCA